MTTPFESAQDPLPLLEMLQTVAFGRFSADGHLREANPRFLNLVDDGDAGPLLSDLVVEGQREEVARLFADREPMEAPRYLHFSRAGASPVTLTVQWLWNDGDLIFIGEAPVAELEESQAVLSRLNSRVAELARENAKKSAELEKSLSDLVDSHWHLRRLQELLPICAYCGKVRTGEDYWQSVQRYLQENADFLTHGICPDCLKLQGPAGGER
jgi:hypothetical protein